MEWTVLSSPGVCSSCARAFGEREEYLSALFEAGEGFARRDYCGVCREGADGAFCRWRARAKKKPAPPKRFVDDTVLLEFFDRLCESADPGKAKFRFIMAVLLMRKRLLKERSRRRDAQGVMWNLEAPKIGKFFEIRDEGLNDVEVAEVLTQIGQVLNVELDNGGRTDAGAAAAAEETSGAVSPQASETAGG